MVSAHPVKGADENNLILRRRDLELAKKGGNTELRWQGVYCICSAPFKATAMVRELPDRKFMLDRFTDIRDAIRK